MAGISSKGIFKERISPFLKNKMEKIKAEKGFDSEEYQALYNQYVKTEMEYKEEAERNTRHWEADMSIKEDSEVINHGIERLYRQCLVIEPTMACAAHCRYCLRGNYNIFTLNEEELTKIAKFCGQKGQNGEVSEVLISGGDPFIVPNRLDHLIASLIKYAPNIKRARIGTRLPQHDPQRVDNNIFEIFKKYSDYIGFEVATQTNHVIEFFPETIQIFEKIKALRIPIYSQNVLVKGVNDNLPALVALYQKMRDLGIEAHYLFHSVPMRGMHHLRTSVNKGLDLSKQLTNSGLISGRSKPMFALMTDVGKITLYEGTILKKDENNRLLIQSSYKLEDRLNWNPDWKLPHTSEVDENGYLRVWYLDGNEDD